MAVSWGGHESLAMQKCASLADGEFNRHNREHKMVRFYFGLEEAAYLIDDLENAFSSI
jgi:cystathionine beta-lyase/cystathionine gamma-synthase